MLHTSYNAFQNYQNSTVLDMWNFVETAGKCKETSWIERFIQTTWDPLPFVILSLCGVTGTYPIVVTSSSNTGKINSLRYKEISVLILKRTNKINLQPLKKRCKTKRLWQISNQLLLVLESSYPRSSIVPLRFPFNRCLLRRRFLGLLAFQPLRRSPSPLLHK